MAASATMAAAAAVTMMAAPIGAAAVVMVPIPAGTAIGEGDGKHLIPAAIAPGAPPNRAHALQGCIRGAGPEIGRRRRAPQAFIRGPASCIESFAADPLDVLQHAAADGAAVAFVEIRPLQQRVPEGIHVLAAHAEQDWTCGGGGEPAAELRLSPLRIGKWDAGILRQGFRDAGQGEGNGLLQAGAGVVLRLELKCDGDAEEG